MLEGFRCVLDTVILFILFFFLQFSVLSLLSSLMPCMHWMCTRETCLCKDELSSKCIRFFVHGEEKCMEGRKTRSWPFGPPQTFRIFYKKKCYLFFIFNNKGCSSSNVHVVCPLLLATCFSSMSLSWLNISQLRTVSLLGSSSREKLCSVGNVKVYNIHCMPNNFSIK